MHILIAIFLTIVVIGAIIAVDISDKPSPADCELLDFSWDLDPYEFSKQKEKEQEKEND